MSAIPTVNITDSALYKVLGEWLLSMLGSDANVVQGQLNRIAMPKGNYIVMTLLGPRQDLHKGARNTVWDGDASTESITKSAQGTLQIDFYGSAASDQAAKVMLLVSSEFNFDYFATQAANGGPEVQPLFAGGARNLALINGEGQYESRWTFDLHFQYNPIITFPQDFMDGLDAHAVSVESQFPLE